MWGHTSEDLGAFRLYDLSRIAIEDTIPPTLGGEDTISNETVDSIHMVEQEVETNDMVIAQLAPCGLDEIVVLSAENPTTANCLPAMNLTVPDAPPS
nr:hypothetical protein CFP56_43263 [Quercus suber]